MKVINNELPCSVSDVSSKASDSDMVNYEVLTLGTEIITDVEVLIEIT